MKNESRFDMKLRPDELAMLKRLAEEKRCSASQVVRELVRAAHADAFSGKRKGAAR